MSFDDDEVFGGGGMKFLAPTRAGGPRRSPSRQSIKNRQSSASLRGSSSLAQSLDVDASNAQHSLAHELAFAMMPDASSSSKFLAEEFGIEYDEGAEGIDEQSSTTLTNGDSLAAELNDHEVDAAEEKMPALAINTPPDEFPDDSVLEPETPIREKKLKPVVDPMVKLAKDVETTEKFLADLKRLDAEAGPSSSQPSLEKIASDMIRRIDESVRDREGQVRELAEMDREFRKIAGELNGNDILGSVDPLDEVENLTDKATSEASRPAISRLLETVREESRLQNGDASNDWETNPDDQRLGDDDEYGSEPESPTVATKDIFPQPPTISYPPSAAGTLPYFAHVRTVTASLATSLVAISEHAQVNGAASTDAGRKIRALKNKLGGWRTEWESAERSRVKIERFEAGLPEEESFSGTGTPPRIGSTKRVDGRRIVEEQLRAFELVLAEAGMKTQAIMTRS